MEIHGLASLAGSAGLTGLAGGWPGWFSMEFPTDFIDFLMNFIGFKILQLQAESLHYQLGSPIPHFEIRYESRLKLVKLIRWSILKIMTWLFQKIKRDVKKARRDLTSHPKVGRDAPRI